MGLRPLAVLVLLAALLAGDAANAQFRRGMLQGGTEITLYPHSPPALLLPAGAVQVEVRNQSRASSRVTGRLRDLFARQLTENDERLDVAGKGGVVVTATLVEWSETRRSSTMYVSERRQIGTREVTDKDGKRRTEPVYEEGRNKPSVEIEAEAVLRVEVRHGAGATPIADETVRQSVDEEHLQEAGVPTRDEVEDVLLDRIVRRGAGRISPGRTAVRVPLARSDEVDRLNALAEGRRWQDWLSALEAVRPHRDGKRDAYRLHNLAVAQEAIAYASTTVEDWKARLGLAASLMAQAAAKHPTERYITEAAGRIAQSGDAYARLAALYAEAGATTPARRAGGGSPRAPAGAPPAPAAAMTNQDVVDLRSAGLDDANLIAAIADARAVQFDLSPTGLKALLAAKVSNPVIAAMRSRAPK